MPLPKQKGLEAMYSADDPFAPPPPSWSWTGAEIGDTLECTIVKAPVLIQQLDTNRKPEFWDSGEKKMTAVTVINVEGAGTFSLWASKPSSLFQALIDASKEAEESMRPGGSLAVIVADIVEPKRKARDPQRIFTAEYVGPNE